MPQTTSTLLEDPGPAPYLARSEAEALKRANHFLEGHVLERAVTLSETQFLLRTILENLDQALVLLDQNQRVRLCNPRALELLRLPAMCCTRAPHSPTSARSGMRG